MKLNEILNKKIDYEVVTSKPNKFYTKAKIGNRIIEFNANQGSYGEFKDIWDIQFYEKKDDEKENYYKTGSGNELEVFGFVKDSILEFISKYQPNKISFTASSTQEDNRANTYERLLKRFISRLPNYSFGRKIDPKYLPRYQVELFTIVKNT